MASQSAGLSLTVRFATSLPDLALAIANPHYTSVLSLICQVRERLPADYSTLRLRLIHAGRVLIPTASVAAALRLPPSTLPPNVSETAKGKAPVRGSAAPLQNVYIHATFSDAVTPELLLAEATEAQALDIALLPANETDSDSSETRRTSAGFGVSNARKDVIASTQDDGSSSRADSGATQAPQGFDRLLSAGLSPLEVASLRSQFVAILAHTHTPDTMPGAAELRVLEERWLDNDHDMGSESGGPASGVAGTGNNNEEDAGGLEDMLWGNIMGFFWPIAAVVWLMREEGVWTQRRRLAVVTGALVNLAFGIMRAAN